MKPNLTKEYPYIGQYYGYTLITSADGTVTETRYNINPEQVGLSLSTNLLGDLVIDSKIKMQLNGIIRNIVDKNNEEIYVGGGWKIIQTAPLLSGIGTKEGYKYRATLIEGQI